MGLTASPCSRATAPSSSIASARIPGSASSSDTARCRRFDAAEVSPRECTATRCGKMRSGAYGECRRGVVGAAELDVEARGLLEVVADDRLELVDLIFRGVF